MNGIDVLLGSLRWSHEILAMVTADLTPEQAAWIPPGIANPIGAQSAHAVCADDWVVQSLLRGSAPLLATSWADRTGVSVPQPTATFDWARSVTVDLPALRDYGAAVAAASEAYVAGLSEADLDREVDLSFIGLGRRPIGWVLNANVVGHINNMAGEISALKGALGATGYPC